LALLVAPLLARAADAEKRPQDDPAFIAQGEYVGDITDPDGNTKKIGVQVIALKDGKFHSVGYIGGLPGDGWDRSETKEADGKLAGGIVDFPVAEGKVTLKPGEPLKVEIGDFRAEFKKVERKSPTLGAKPPDGAVVLFDGTNADKWLKGRMTGDGLLMQGATTKDKFRDCQLHVEFLLPFMPDMLGQQRGNSGCYLQGRYEVQILDSFGLKGEDNECGAVYKVHAPEVNMCFPPGVWQTYDIDYKASRYEGHKKVKSAFISVKHNGVQVQKDVELTHTTTAAPVPEESSTGPIYLQDHGCPVLFRNIWLVEEK